MTKLRVTELINEYGLCYIDMYVAREFAHTSGQPETDVLSVIRRQEQINLASEGGRGKHERARESAVMALAHGWTCESLATPPEMIARLELATAYALLARLYPSR